ncbi:MAG: hypothetical protein QOD72_3718 [Acidimicrobiaceae bacterium]|nr:hypothetical protein [Acidimicrobiaceae bacterium]
MTSTTNIEPAVRPTTTRDVAPWPSARSRRTAIVAQFGGDRADLAQWALTTADPLADAVAAAIHAEGKAVRAAFNTGVTNGLASLTDPHPAVAALLASTETRPDYADDDLLDRGSAAFYTSPGPVHLVSLSAGALIRVYDSPSIASVLATTGRLIDGAERRIRETGQWVATAMLPGALRGGQPGYVATLQVRLLHALKRDVARRRGFDEAAFGAPINQVDLARTWMDFTLTSQRAEEQMGFGLTTSESASLYRYWWLLAHLLGIDARLVEGIASNDQAARVDELLQAVTGSPIPESAQLAAATVASISADLHEALSIPTGLGAKALSTLARRFHGETLSDDLGLAHSATASAVLNKAIEATRARRRKLRRDPAKWDAAREKHLVDARKQLAAITDAPEYAGPAR